MNANRNRLANLSTLAVDSWVIVIFFAQAWITHMMNAIVGVICGSVSFRMSISVRANKTPEFGGHGTATAVDFNGERLNDPK